MGVVDGSLEELEARRAELFALMAAVGDFRRGSVSVSFRKCGKTNCACAKPGHPGHGPRTVWTAAGPGGKTVGRQLSPGEVDKVRAEVAAWHRFSTLAGELAQVSEAICEARPVQPPGVESVGMTSNAASDGERGGSRVGSGRRSRRRSPPNSTG